MNNKYWFSVSNLSDEVTPMIGTNFISDMAQKQAKYIDEQMELLGVTPENAKEYGIDITLHDKGNRTYQVYKKQYIGSFNV